MKVHIEVPCAIPEVGPQEVAYLSYTRKGAGGEERGKEVYRFHLDRYPLCTGSRGRGK